ncbi:histidinol dehydrogenase [Tindallia magadiensis]|uniref:Histidinol dehydrogenase n=1 Tax=Tindallia magadiensis TaxID=69895 RepID=A0A1I3DWW5_9FIRM|nr:histidinol dehydrogenase [Tindallia magadiensis]SFH91123.1 histidinol dehydrogenase [Tindallia magadiensis]
MRIVDWKDSEGEAYLEALQKRQQATNREIEVKVRDLLEEVKEKGNLAVIEMTAIYDKARLTEETMKVSSVEIEEAVSQVDKAYLKAIRRAQEKISRFHERQRQLSWFENPEPGVTLGQKVTPLDCVGIYVPGGTAAYPSSVLMNAVPAKVAGVERIVMTTPPDQEGKVNPVILAAAYIAGVDEIYKIGGAQAIGAMAFGTATVPKVDKITGPGNQYVATAKKMVYGQVDIDMIAGPSEILVIADEKADPAYIAADLLSQAEHDQLSSAICITTNRLVAEKVLKQLERQLEKLERQAIARKSMENYGGIWVVDSLEKAVSISNRLAPEHLELCVEKPFELLEKIKHAGAIFMGHYSPEPLGDYIAGPNHVLPTEGTARFYSPLSVEDFVKKSSIISYTREAMEKVADDVILMAEKEGLPAHGQAIRIRRR